MSVKVARLLVILFLLAGILISLSSCATRPRKCNGRSGIMTPMGVM